MRATFRLIPQATRFRHSLRFALTVDRINFRKFNRGPDDIDIHYDSTLPPAAWSYAKNQWSEHNQLSTKSFDGLSGKEISKIAQQIKKLEPTAELVNNILEKRKELLAVNQMEKEVKSAVKPDLDSLKWIESERASYTKDLLDLEDQLLDLVLPKDKDDSRNVILELRPGTGGEEAALFVEDIFKMYQKFIVLQGWKHQLLSATKMDRGGYKEVCMLITGHDVFGTFKYEAGGHRVQRVPATESQGRVHTSAMTVTVLPEAEEVDVEIKETDLKIETMRSSGAGGQSVNTTDSAVRITHLPTGITVSMQDERSQLKNRSRAMQVLRSRLYEAERRRLDEQRAAQRKEQTVSGDRSDRIRTYNFSQSRVTDHRINSTKHGIEKMFSGEHLMEFIDELKRRAKEQEIERFVNGPN